VIGPLANFMSHKDSDEVETIQANFYRPPASDHVGGSVVGTSRNVLHQTFAVTKTVDLPFEVPAHGLQSPIAWVLPIVHSSRRRSNDSSGRCRVSATERPAVFRFVGGASERCFVLR